MAKRIRAPLLLDRDLLRHLLGVMQTVLATFNRIQLYSSFSWLGDEMYQLIHMIVIENPSGCFYPFVIVNYRWSVSIQTLSRDMDERKAMLELSGRWADCGLEWPVRPRKLWILTRAVRDGGIVLFSTKSQKPVRHLKNAIHILAINSSCILARKHFFQLISYFV